MQIELTTRAAEKLHKLFRMHHLSPQACLRVRGAGGCACGGGVQLDVAENPQAEDQVCESQGLRIVCDPQTADALDGALIDYDTDLGRQGFVLSGVDGCSCGD